MGDSWAAQRDSFNSAADLYDKYRPTYPEDLITDALTPFPDPHSVRILEIGSGTGQATRAFAARDCQVLAVEPAADMVKIAAAHLADKPKVSFENCKFEDWDIEREAFDLAVSAISIFWVPRDVRYKLIAAALKPEGYYAYLQTDLSISDKETKELVTRAYTQVLPKNHQLYPAEPSSEPPPSFDVEIAESGFFMAPETKEYSLPNKTLDRDSYLGLLDTKSHHIILGAPLKEQLYKKIGAIIDDAGGSLELTHSASMYLAQKLG